MDTFFPEKSDSEEFWKSFL